MKKLIYTIVLVGAFQFAQGQIVIKTYFYTPGPPASIGDSISYPMPDAGKAYNVGITFLAVNGSPADFPTGTIFTYEVTIGNAQPFTVVDTLAKDLKKDSAIFARYYWTRQIGPHNSSLGKNNICATITKVDGVDYSLSAAICAIYTFTGDVGIADAEALKEVKVYPNPVRDNLKIENLNEVTDISVYTITGQVVRTVSSIMGSAEIDMSGLANGLYFVKMQNGKSIRTEKIQVVR